VALVRADQTPSNPVKAPTADVPREILRDQWRRPLIVTPSGEVRGYTRASSLGGVLEDQTGIGIWKQRQVAWAVAHSRTLRVRGQAIPNTTEQANKALLKALAYDALDYADSNEAAQRGTAFHALTEQHDAGRPLPDLDPDDAAVMAAYGGLIRHFTVHGMENFVVCDELDTAGTYDRVLSPRVELQIVELDLTIAPTDRVIDDLKTSSTADYFGIKFAVQETVYGNGTPYRGWVDRDELARLGYDRELPLDELNRLPLKVKKAITRGERMDWPDGIAPRTDVGLIMHVPSGGDTAQLYAVDLVQGIELARLARDVQDWRSRKGLVVPVEAPRAQMPTALNAAGLLSVIAAVPHPSPEAFNALWEANRSVWTNEHFKACTARLNRSRVGSRLGRA
jgi:hypothetical protein